MRYRFFSHKTKEERMAHPGQHYGERKKPPTNTKTHRWCFTCDTPPQPADSGMEWWTPGCEAINTCDVADALVLRADMKGVGTYRLKASRRSVDDPWEYVWVQKRVIE